MKSDAVVLDTSIWIYAKADRYLGSTERTKSLWLFERFRDKIVIPPFVTFELLQSCNSSQEERETLEADIAAFDQLDYDTFCAKIAAEYRRTIVEHQIISGTKKDSLPEYLNDLYILSFCLRWPFIGKLIVSDGFYQKAIAVLHAVSLVQKLRLTLEVIDFRDESLQPAQASLPL